MVDTASASRDMVSGTADGLNRSPPIPTFLQNNYSGVATRTWRTTHAVHSHMPDRVLN